MAALIAGHGRGSTDGILGIAPAAKILPIKISNSENNAPPTEMGKGIDWAVSQKAGVVNVSAGVGPSFEVQDAVDAAMEADVVVVASAGNSSSSALIGYPAAIDGVLAVGAVGRDGKHASLSVKDSKVLICAPGVDVTTAEPKNKYVDVGGTSPSAAIASGAAALVRAKFPQLSAEEVIHRLTATADDIGPPGRDDECGFGRLNIVKALTASVPPLRGGDPTPSAGPTTAAASAPAPTGAAPETEAAGSGTPVILGGLVGLVVAGGLAVMLALRRRRDG